LADLRVYFIDHLLPVSELNGTPKRGTYFDLDFRGRGRKAASRKVHRIPNSVTKPPTPRSLTPRIRAAIER